jgi:general secretion pathway protein K
MTVPLTDRRGFALVAVLWVLVLTSALAVELHAGVRADQRVAASARAQTRAKWAARGGMARAVETLRARLARAAVGGAGLVTTDTLLVDVPEFDLDRVKVKARIVDARSRLQLNLATAEELRALFVAVGVEFDRATSLANATVRWRGEHLPPFEAEPRDSSRIALRPPPGAFAAVEELRDVPGVTEDDYARAAPHLTVASDGRINLNTAPVPVLMTLRGIGRREAEVLVDRRRRAPLLTPYELVELLPRGSRTGLQDELAALAARTAFVPREGEIRVEARAPGASAVGRLYAVAVMTGGTRLPVVGVAER